MNAIEAHALTRRFGDQTAVDAVELNVHAGEIFALLGVNGAGKTTLIRMLTGLLRPSAGDALIFGRSITREMDQIKPLLGVSPQETAVAPNLTVRENLCLMAGLHGMDRARAEEVLGQLHLREVASARARTLSGGWMRRLSIAMALVNRPRLLFLDEPTLGLDVLVRRELWQFIADMRGSSTVVLTTHYLEEAEALADRIGVMAHGRLSALGTAQELMALTGASRFEDAFVALAGGEALS